ncbi:MAG TPA: hemerythrin family protein [Prolixibacteraceae bacterium]|nr:hemerythrin family protein [Prolixibacteraceae bacterium]HPR85254.1 hemerythrin family protein [Prolixibacteraceae bacterium]
MEFTDSFSNKNLSIGNNDIDDDHTKLIEIINDLNDLIQTRGTREDFARILSLMTDYSLTHFRQEELYMQEFDYPKFNVHKKSHLEYIYKVSNYNLDLAKKNPPEPQEIVDFLRTWWQNHILMLDAAYEKYRKQANIEATYRKISRLK